MSEQHSNEPLTFESVGGGWVGVFVLLGAFIFLITLSAMRAGIGGEPKLLGYLFGLGLGVWTIVAGFRTRSLGGIIVIDDGHVRVYKRTRSKTKSLDFEAPYSAFREIRVTHIEANEGGGPGVVVAPIHELRKTPKISLFERDETKTLDQDDRRTLERVSREIGVPIVGL